MTVRYLGVATSIGAALTALSCLDPTTVPAPVGISVSTAELNLVLDEQRILRAWLIGDRGLLMNGTPAWTSSDPTIATIGRDNGVVTAIDIGTTTMTATFGNFRAMTTVTVRPPNPPSTVTISEAPQAVIAGVSDSLVATAYDAKGQPTSVAVAWSSSDPTVATIGHADGVVAGIAAGVTTITASAGTIRATLAMTVVELTSSLSFTRWQSRGQNTYSTDAFTFSAADRQMLPVERTAGFTSIASPTWSEDGSSLAIEVIHGFVFDAPNYAEDYNSDLYARNAAAPAGSPWRALTTNRLSKSPRWSPDGTRVAYLRQEQLFFESNIYVIDVGTGVHHRVTTEAGWYGPPSWSPDGKRLVFAAWIEFSNYLLSNWEIFVVNVDGSGLTRISSHPGVDVSPSWSPDGRQIAFVSTRGSTAGDVRGSVYVMNVDGSSYRRLTAGYVYMDEVVWSPDGRQVAFSAGGSLYVMNADGSLVARLTRPGVASRDRSPSWRR
jgi:TolB protein